MLGLIYNEMQKVIKRKRLLIVTGFMLLLCAFCVYSAYHESINREQWENPEKRKANIESNIRNLEDQLKNANLSDTDKERFNQWINDSKKELQNVEDQLKNTKSGWKTSLTEEVNTLKKSIEEAEKISTDKKAVSYMQTQLQEKEYLLEHSIRPDISYKLNAYKLLLQVMEIMSILFIPVLAVLLGADMVSSEFSPTTIKLLLVRPVSKWKILASKYIALILCTLTFVIVGLTAVFIFGGIAFGWGLGNYPVTVGAQYIYNEVTNKGMHDWTPVLQAGTAYIVPMWKYVLANVGYALIGSIVIATLSFAVSTVIRKSAAAVVFSVVAVIGSFVVGQMFKYRSIMIINFINYLNLGPIWKGEAMSLVVKGNISIAFALGLLALWWLAAMVTSFIVFVKREVMV